MKLLSYFLLALLMISCQQESLVVEEDTGESDFVLDPELSSLMLSVSAHDGTFDDLIDRAGCFSVEFPYTIIYNGETLVINAVEDLLDLDAYRDLEILFPITITYANYETETLNSLSGLIQAINSCASNETFLTSIRCVDFVYPIRIATFNSETNQFNTLFIDHDEQNFTTINAFLEQQQAEIQFPIALRLSNNEVLEINNSEELKQIIYANAQGCE